MVYGVKVDIKLNEGLAIIFYLYHPDSTDRHYYVNYYKQLDGLRTVAITGVIIQHWLQWQMKNDVLKNIPYDTGVNLFFVISGFLITKILLDFKEKNKAAGISQFNSIKSFYIRRSLRIFPIYYITIFVLFAINFRTARELFPWLSTYTTNVYMAMNSKYIGAFNHFWSLAVEEQFYIFWVFVAVFIPRDYLKGTITTFIAVSLLVMYFMLAFTKYWLSDMLVINQMYVLGFGALIAYYQTYEPEFFNKISLSKMKGYLVAGLILYTIIFVFRKPVSLYEPLHYLKNAAISGIYFFVVLIAVRNGFKGILKLFLENRVIVYLGKISYGLYIYHQFVGPLWDNIINRYLHIKTDYIGHFIICFLLNIILASISWYIIEKPVLGLKKYYKY